MTHYHILTKPQNQVDGIYEDEAGAVAEITERNDAEEPRSYRHPQRHLYVCDLDPCDGDPVDLFTLTERQATQ